MKGCIERLIVRRRIELSKLVKRLGDPLEDKKGITMMIINLVVLN